jgi:CheY-like chemotaxis protein
VVDDEADSRELVRRVLVDGEAVPALAASAAEANEMLADFDPNVIVSDIGMPIQDGYAFMRSVREKGLKTPALALTAFARPEDRIRSIQAGYQMHLRKPVDPTELVAVIASLAGRYEADDLR